MVVINLQKRHAERIRVNSDGCWEWQGWKSGNGYGQTKIHGKTVMVHRFVYESHFGPIPKGLVLDHLCKNRSCCNPFHLEPVTPQENTLRGNAILFGGLKI